MTALFTLPKVLALDTNVAAEALAELNFYEAGTTTRLDTYTDSALSVASANPVIADANGQFAPIYLQARNYKVDLTAANGGASLPGYPVDNVDGSGFDTTSITPEQYGATGDGATDDTVNFLAALNAAIAADTVLELTSGKTYLLDTWSAQTLTAGVSIFCKGRATIKGPASTVDFIVPDGGSYLFDGISFERWTKPLHNTTIANTIPDFTVRNCHFDASVMMIEIGGPITRAHVHDCTFDTITHSGVVIFADQATSESVVIDKVRGDVIGSTNVLGGQVFGFCAFGRAVQITGNSHNDCFGNTSTANLSSIYTKAIDVVARGNILRLQTATASALVEVINHKGDVVGGTPPIGVRAIYEGNVLEGVGDIGVGIHSEIAVINDNIIDGFDKGVNLSSSWDDVIITSNRIIGSDKTVSNNNGIHITGATPSSLVVADNLLTEFNMGIEFGPATSLGQTAISGNMMTDIDQYGVQLPGSSITFTTMNIFENHQESGARFYSSSGALVSDLSIKDNTWGALTAIPSQLIEMSSYSAQASYDISGNGPIKFSTANADEAVAIQAALPDNVVGYMEAEIMGMESDGSDRSGYKLAGVFYRDGAGAVQQGTTTVILSEESDAATNATLDVASNDMEVSVFGIAAETWNWSVKASYRSAY